MKIDCDVSGKTARKSESGKERRGGNVKLSENGNERRRDSGGGGEAEVGHGAEGQGHEVGGQDRGAGTGGEEAEAETEIETGWFTLKIQPSTQIGDCRVIVNEIAYLYYLLQFYQKKINKAINSTSTLLVRPNECLCL